MASKGAAGLPHVLLITCHDIGRHLGCYGVETVHTPHLDALAAEGVRLARAFTTAPSCSPARAALATGRYPHSNGVMGLVHPPFGWSLRRGERHMARILRRAGYETHLFGHQHVSPRVADLGFEHLHGYDQLLGTHETAIGASVAARVEEFLGERAGRSANRDRPLYVEVNLEEPHRPYDQGGARPDESRGVWVPPWLPQEPEAYQEMAALQGAIRQADAAVGRILAQASARLGPNLLTIFAADHGLAMPRAKCTLYDPGLEIALLLRWPDGGLDGGRVVEAMVSNVDVLPTLLQVLGLPAPSGVQGQSFLAAARGEKSAGRTVIYAEKTYHSYYDPMRALRTERFKYIRNREPTFRVEVPGDIQRGAIFRAHPEAYSGAEHAPAELYDLDADPYEQHNLAGQEAYREVEGQLGDQLRSWMLETKDPLTRGWVPSPKHGTLPPPTPA